MRVDWVILADSADVVNNKLYLLGGGWDALTLPGPLPHVHQFAVAVSVSVEWNETNERYPVQILVTDHDHRNVIASVDGEFEVGRPAGIPAGQDQRLQITAQFNPAFPEPGGYSVVVRINGDDRGRSTFWVRVSDL